MGAWAGQAGLSVFKQKSQTPEFLQHGEKTNNLKY